VKAVAALRDNKKYNEIVKCTLDQQLEIEWGVPFENTLGAVWLLGRIEGKEGMCEK